MRTADLHSKSRELEAFAYSVAHDLKRRCVALTAIAGILLEEYGQSRTHEGRAFLQTIQHSTDEMNQLIDDLRRSNLEYARRSSINWFISSVEC